MIWRFFSSVFVTPAGEWKLFGLEQMRSASPGTPPNAEQRSPILSKYIPPELKSSPHAETTSEQDMWGLGCIVWEVYIAIFLKYFHVIMDTYLPIFLIDFQNFCLFF